MKPKISIIVPVYNVEIYLSLCIDSILKQTYTNFELLLVDDGSSDNSGRICDEYALRDNRIRVFHKENGGVASARILGIEKSIADWMMFVDSDDALFPDACNLMITTVEKFNSDVLVAGFAVSQQLLVTNLDHGSSKQFTNNELIEEIILERVVPSLWGKLFKSSLFDQMHRSEYLIKIGEDFLVTLYALTKASQITVIQVPVYFYRQRKDSVMNSPAISATNSRLYFLYEARKILKKQVSLMSAQMVDDFIATLFIREFFSYIRDGGNSPIEKQVIEQIEEYYMDNEYMLAHTPAYRRLIVGWYMRSNFIGKVMILGLKVIRKVVLR